MHSLEGQYVGVNYDRAASRLSIRQICPLTGMIMDRIQLSPSIHLRDAVFQTHSLTTASKEWHMGWVAGTVIDPDDAPVGEGKLIRINPNCRDRFFTAVTGETCVKSRFVSIIDKDIHAFGLET